MDTRILLAAVLLLLSCSAPAVLSHRSLETISNLHGLAATSPPAAGGGGGNADALPCIQKLMPCQPYIHAPNPPATCCAPLKEILEKDVTCLCAVFNNPDMLRSLNLTKDNALDLPKACGANADVSLCNKTATPPTASPATPTTPPASSNGTSSSGNSTKGPATKNAAAAVSFTGLTLVSAFVATFCF